MLSLITPENLPGVLTAIGGLVGAGGLVTIVRIWRNPTPRPGSPDAAALALAENTKALTAMADHLGGQNAQFIDNNRLFGDVIHHVEAMAKDFAEARKEMSLAREHLAALREQGNRRTR